MTFQFRTVGILTRVRGLGITTLVLTMITAGGVKNEKKDCLLIQGKPPANTCIFTFVWPDLWILLSLWKNWLRRSWSNCLEQPKQLVLLWVIDIKCRVGSHQSSDRTANPVASSLLNHLICNQKCVMVTVCLPNDDQSWWTWCHFICLIVVVCLKQRYYCN